jgi:hypothetical protein
MEPGEVNLYVLNPGVDGEISVAPGNEGAAANCVGYLTITTPEPPLAPVLLADGVRLVVPAVPPLPVLAVAGPGDLLIDAPAE